MIQRIVSRIVLLACLGALAGCAHFGLSGAMQSSNIALSFDTEEFPTP